MIRMKSEQQFSIFMGSTISTYTKKHCQYTLKLIDYCYHPGCWNFAWSAATVG